MVRSGNSEHVRFRYGMCLNENCSKCKSKEVQTISARKDFVCSECGKALRECPPPARSKNKLVMIIVAVVVVAAGVIVGIKLVEKPKPVKVDPPKPITGRGTVDLGYGIYTGELKNGVPHGHGVIKYTQKHKIVSSKDFVANPGDEFEADFRDGRVSGNIGYWSHDGNKTAIKP